MLMIEFYPVHIGVPYGYGKFMLHRAEGFDEIFILRENGPQVLDVLVEMVGV